MSKNFVSYGNATGLMQAIGDKINEGGGSKLKTTKVKPNNYPDFFNKIWSGLSSFDGDYIWTDGTNIYYSDGSTQYVLDKSTSTWSTKTWSGLNPNSFYGNRVWTDGTNIYFSNGSSYQYVLDKSTSTWSAKTWSGLSSFYGDYIWTDGTNIYYSDGSTQYVLDKSTSTWSTKTWSGLSSFEGNRVWTDGTDIYYSSASQQYVLNKSTSTWSTKAWSGLSSFRGDRIWTDGTNIYYSDSLTQYVLDKSTSTWSAKTWSGLSSFNGNYIWTDGTNIYFSNGSAQCKLNEDTKADQTLIAPIEMGTTASQSYSIGQQFVLNGILKKAKAAIAVDEAFTDSNCEDAYPVTTQIKTIADRMNVAISSSVVGGKSYTFNVPTNWAEWPKIILVHVRGSSSGWDNWEAAMFLVGSFFGTRQTIVKVTTAKHGSVTYNISLSFPTTDQITVSTSNNFDYAFLNILAT